MDMLPTIWVVAATLERRGTGGQSAHTAALLATQTTRQARCPSDPAPIGCAPCFQPGLRHATDCRTPRPHPTEPDDRHRDQGPAHDRGRQECRLALAGRA